MVGGDVDIVTEFPTLMENDVKLYDNVAVLDQVKSFGGVFKVGHLMDFVSAGGNVLIGAKPNEAIREFAAEFGVSFGDQLATVDGSNVLKSFTKESKYVTTPSPVQFNGVSHSLSGKNHLSFPILVGNPLSFASKDGSYTSGKVGSDLVLISGFQTRQNARIVFAGSSDFFSNADRSVTLNGKETKVNNQDIVKQLLDWTFQKKSVLRLTEATHHVVNETVKRTIYRIKDDVEFSVKIEEKKNGQWVPFIANDVQFEAIMLDPYVRQAISFNPATQSYLLRFKLPDQYGVFTYKLDYRRHGLTFVLFEETVQVRPFRHDQYPRFLTVAWPYYANLFACMGGFFVLSIVVLYNRDTGAIGKTKVKVN